MDEARCLDPGPIFVELVFRDLGPSLGEYAPGVVLEAVLRDDGHVRLGRGRLLAVAAVAMAVLAHGAVHADGAVPDGVVEDDRRALYPDADGVSPDDRVVGKIVA